MQYVNDDMDDVFRRAAENYPLDTGGADWNKVLAGLQGQETKPANKKDGRRFLWLLMLLPLGLMCNYYYYGRHDKGNKTDNGNKVDVVNAVNGTTKSQQNNSTNGDQIAVKISTAQSGNNGLDMAGSKDAGTTGSQVNTPLKNHAVFGPLGQRKPASGNYYSQQLNSGRTSNYQDVNPGNASGNNSATGQDLIPDKASSYTSFIKHSKNGLAAVAIHPSTDFAGVSNNLSHKPGLEKKPPKFYLGLMGGFDKTTIEGQKTSQHGSDYGMLIGYRIGKKWAAEAGAFMDKKYYYTQGKYFKNDGMYVPPNSWITEVDGSCRMWDLSIGGSYSLVQNKNSTWFVATGMSSYIMKEENYDYTYYYAGSGTSAVHSKTYYNESKDFFSIVNLSAGYTHHFGKITDLRVEPYVKLPVQGVGVGNLSLLSAGIHIGITGKLF